MYLWDSNILCYHNQQHVILQAYLQRAAVMSLLLKQHSSRKRYADLMIAAIAIAGYHVVVTRNQKHFADLLPKHQLQNWIDGPPTN